MLEVRLKAGEIVELDNSRIRKILAHEPLVCRAVRRSPSDVKPANGRDLRCGRMQRLEHLLAFGIRDGRPGAE
jgi:hypothetical protein